MLAGRLWISPARGFVAIWRGPRLTSSSVCGHPSTLTRPTILRAIVTILAIVIVPVITVLASAVSVLASRRVRCCPVIPPNPIAIRRTLPQPHWLFFFTQWPRRWVLA